MGAKIHFCTQTWFKPQKKYLKKCVSVTRGNMQQNNAKYKLNEKWWGSEQNKTNTYREKKTLVILV